MPGNTQVVAAECDPVTAALADAVVLGRLTAAAHAFLARRSNPLPEAMRAAEAEFITSKVHEEALRRRADYEPGRDVVAWLVGFVANVTRDHLRTLARNPTGPPPDAPALEDLAVDLGRPAADAVADREFVGRLLAHLPAADRELIRQKYADGLTFAEIAAAHGINENAARVRHHRILGRLRDLCGEVRS